jgi:hypothetical protein
MAQPGPVAPFSISPGETQNGYWRDASVRVLSPHIAQAKKHETKFHRVRITNQRLLSPSNKTERSSHKGKGKAEEIMDAKWNPIVDNVVVRTTLLILGFGAWLAISYGILSL